MVHALLYIQYKTKLTVDKWNLYLRFHSLDFGLDCQ